MDDKRISRREMLRNIGLAGAATWAAPVLTGRRAYASVDRCAKKKAHKLCRYMQGIWDCGACSEGFYKCGTCNSDVGDGSYCFARLGT